MDHVILHYNTRQIQDIQMSWNRLLEKSPANRIPSSALEDSLQFSQNKLHRKTFQQSLNHFNVVLSTPPKSSNSQSQYVMINYSQLKEILDLTSDATLKVQQLERRLKKPVTTEVSTQTQ